MKILSRFGFVIFWIIALMDVAFIYFENENLRYFTKPLIIPIIFLTVISKIHPHKHKKSKLYISLAFLFALVADLILLSKISLLSSLSFCLLTQVCLSVYFLRIQKIVLSSFISITATSFVMAGIAAFILLEFKQQMFPDIIPILIFWFFLSLMVIFAINIIHNPKARNLALSTFIPGAALWVFSYVVLGLNIYYFKEQVLNIVIVLSYSTGLYYFSMGIIRHMKYSKPHIKIKTQTIA